MATIPEIVDDLAVCPGCGSMRVEATNPLKVLRRLPESVFNLDGPLPDAEMRELFKNLVLDEAALTDAEIEISEAMFDGRSFGRADIRFNGQLSLSYDGTTIPSDGETIVVNGITFEFDTNGSVVTTPTLIQVDISAAGTADAAWFIFGVLVALQFPALTVTQDAPGDAINIVGGANVDESGTAGTSLSFVGGAAFASLSKLQASVQYEIARTVAELGDQFVLGWRRAVADQHGLGLLDTVAVIDYDAVPSEADTVELNGTTFEFDTNGSVAPGNVQVDVDGLGGAIDDYWGTLKLVMQEALPDEVIEIQPRKRVITILGRPDSFTVSSSGGSGSIGVTGQCPHAEGVDLDKVTAQFGVGRPFGFNDCCLWALFQLIRWTPNPTMFAIKLIVRIFTGIDPVVQEQPSKIRLISTAPLPNFSEVIDDHAFYWADETDTTGIGGFAPPAWSFFSELGPQPAGMTLEQALDTVKPAGVAIELVNFPPAGFSGCYAMEFRTTDPADAEQYAFWGDNE